MPSIRPGETGLVPFSASQHACRTHSNGSVTPLDPFPESSSVGLGSSARTVTVLPGGSRSALEISAEQPARNTATATAIDRPDGGPRARARTRTATAWPANNCMNLIGTGPAASSSRNQVRQRWQAGAQISTAKIASLSSVVNTDNESDG